MALLQSDVMKFKNNSTVQKNVSGIVQIFNAIPSSIFSVDRRRAVGEKNRLKAERA